MGSIPIGATMITPIHWGEHALATTLDQMLAQHEQVFLLLDENVLEFCYPKLLAICPALKKAEVIEIESGEAQKNIDIATQLWEMLTQHQATRKSLWINLGGGVVSDLGGFVAATYKRGIDFVQIPTTLLAQVDASVGGKQAIDFLDYKNQIGVFAMPKAVFIHADFLDTLPDNHLLAGFMEMVKHALILDKAYWQDLQHLQIDTVADLLPLIQRSVEIKQSVVAQDPTELGLRKCLNFGHTFGHALETLLMHSENPLLHGEAVGLGMILETKLSAHLGFLPQAEATAIIAYLEKRLAHLLPILEKIDIQALLPLLLQDKKNTNTEQISFVLLKGIGSFILDISLDANAIHAYSPQA